MRFAHAREAARAHMSAADIDKLANRLTAARASQQALSVSECEALQIASREEAYAVQAAVWQCLLGSARPRAWKIGNSSDSPVPVRAAMPRIISHAASISAADFRLLGMEAEIAVRFARDLPARGEPWSRDEVLAAIGSAHVAIEIVDTALQDYVAAGPFLRLADSMLHGAFVLGEALCDWQGLAWHALTMQSFVDGALCAEATGGHPHVDPFALLPWWANEGAQLWGGVMAGDIVTTGTWNGMHFSMHPSCMEARLSGPAGEPLGRASVQVAQAAAAPPV
ncbi:fumarylacetoacetate hydrolase family protein [Uliginosibacterium sp. H3]|uniref:Fumarylacetoacetate hydrolase family protein n=1 Tax=Uliginosibacterium silvisoli TaxID=3114758 RepID=A0ABU6JZ23_9RHOO|nr:fumarylacetoacetate hydrolase family protein [Uliginosibacterium sp. H3]